MQFLEIQAPVADQVSGQQQNRDLVAIAGASTGIRIDVQDIDSHRGHLRQSGKFAQHLLAKAAPGTGIQQEAPLCGGHDAQWLGTSLLPTTLTECAMNSTVCAGTSPTAVT
ncbi:MAG: hypothetical protein QOF42_1641 [Gammaproteobacteria bacterium]|nr:hypothetical protein [Gammaproteobacteria bacterium]